MYARAAAAIDLATAALDQFDIGTLVVNNGGTVAVANHALISLAATRDGLELGRSGLSLHDADEDAELQRTLEGWCRAPARMERTALSVTRPSGRRPYNIVFRPIEPSVHTRLTEARLLMICVYDPTRLDRLKVDPIMELFRSPARKRGWPPLLSQRVPCKPPRSIAESPRDPRGNI